MPRRTVPLWEYRPAMKVGPAAALTSLALAIAACSSLDPLEEEHVETLEVGSATSRADSGTPSCHRSPTVSRCSSAAA